MKRVVIAATKLNRNGHIQKGMFWDVDGHTFTVVSVDATGERLCKIKEEWISEDSWRDCERTDVYKVRGAYDDQYAESVSHPGWKLYAKAAFNYPAADPEEDDYVYDDRGEYLDDDYTPSATRGDYSPSNPWDAPGMSVSDFI